MTKTKQGLVAGDLEFKGLSLLQKSKIPAKNKLKEDR